MSLDLFVSMILGGETFALIFMLMLSCAIIYRQQLGSAANLAIASSVVFLLGSYISPLAQLFLFRDHRGLFMMVLASAQIIHLVAWGLLIVGYFAGRNSSIQVKRPVNVAAYLFSFKGTISAREFRGIAIPVIITYLILTICVSIASADILDVSGGFAGVIPYFLLSNYLMLTAYCKRFRDAGNSAWGVLLWFIPLVNFISLVYLFTAKSHQSLNVPVSESE